MMSNALKETKLPATLCRMSPPTSPSRMRALSASHAAAATAARMPPFKSKLLATLDAEIPNWLSGPSSCPADSVDTLLTKAASPTLDSKIIHPLFTSSQPSIGTGKPTSRVQSKAAPAPCYNKVKASAKPSARVSDVENQPEGSMGLDDDIPPAPSRLLPPYSYRDYTPTPAVVYTADEGEANDLVQCLKGPVLGFDLEWVVLFRRGRAPIEHKTALVQLCDARMILLIHVSSMKKFPEKVQEVIEGKDIFKLGANIKNDGHKLFRDYGILARSLVELGVLAHQADPSFSQTYKRSVVSLARVVEMYTRKTLAKGKVRTSNWERKPLSEEQKFYAANDAHCALMVYDRLTTIAAESGLTLQPQRYAADLAQEYLAKTVPNRVAGQVAPNAGLSGPSSVYTVDTSPLPDNLSVLSRPKTSYSRPLVFVGEHRPRNPPSSGGASLNASASATTSTRASMAVVRELPRPQHLRAYNLWHHRGMDLSDICAALRSKDNPLAQSTVITYVVRALQADPALPFSMPRLKALVQLEAGSWARHRDWISQKDGYMR
ncbi:ribonuclease H-like domain-containing protein [Trametes punicea]|nr:ribonuclease H-like domain-containing protein [Trametes punicea]